MTPPSQSYMGRGSHKLASLFGLIFRRSSCQHPLLAGTLGTNLSPNKALEALFLGDRIMFHGVETQCCLVIVPMKVMSKKQP